MRDAVRRTARAADGGRRAPIAWKLGSRQSEPHGFLRSLRGSLRGGGGSASPLARIRLPQIHSSPPCVCGTALGVDVEPEPRFAEASLIAIEFPVFHDGRGLSLAVLLRTRCGYTGELRAVGDVHPELIHYLRRCGFDSFLLPEGHRLSANDDRLAPYSDYYQASIVETLPAFRRDRRGV